MKKVNKGRFTRVVLLTMLALSTITSTVSVMAEDNTKASIGDETYNQLKEASDKATERLLDTYRKSYKEGEPRLMVKPDTLALSPGLGYFDINTEPSKTYELKFKLDNISPDDLDVKVDVTNAWLGEDVTPNYHSNKEIKDSKLVKHKPDVLMSYDKDISIKPSGNDIYTLKITMPKEKFDGTLTYGITFKDKSLDDVEMNGDKGNVMYQEKYQYSIAVILRQGDTNIPPSITIKDVKIDNDTLDFRLVNDSLGYSNRTLITYNLKTSSGKTVAKGQLVNRSFLSNAYADIKEKLNPEDATVGSYLLEVEITGNPAPSDVPKDTKLYKRQATGTDYDNESKDDQLLYHTKLTEKIIVTPTKDNAIRSIADSIKDPSKLPWLLLVLVILLILLYVIYRLVKRWKSRGTKDTTSNED